MFSISAEFRREVAVGLYSVVGAAGAVAALRLAFGLEPTIRGTSLAWGGVLLGLAVCLTARTLLPATRRTDVLTFSLPVVMALGILSPAGFLAFAPAAILLGVAPRLTALYASVLPVRAGDPDRHTKAAETVVDVVVWGAEQETPESLINPPADGPDASPVDAGLEARLLANCRVDPETPARDESFDFGGASTEQAPPCQWMKRTRDCTGSESVRGGVTIDFGPGQKLAVVHLPFSPALEAAPQIECEQLTGDSARIRVALCRAFGARLEVRRSSAESAEEMQIEFDAHVEGQGVPRHCDAA
ncbi:MAG: hypothetical protein CMJ48_11830 [Planctomycetaceae bacterium]|nr:hypothetical protein [Planctomycetaceae bacterium]